MKEKDMTGYGPNGLTQRGDAKYRSPAEVAKEEGYDSADAMLLALADDSGSVPACCDCGCWVEADGTCSHGFASVLLELGFI